MSFTIRRANVRRRNYPDSSPDELRYVLEPLRPAPMTRGYSPPRVEVVEYVIRTNGDPEPVTVKTVETEQAKLSDFTRAIRSRKCTSHPA